MINIFSYILGRLLLRIAPEGRFPAWNRFSLRVMGATVGNGVVVYSSIKISRSINLSIGDASFVGTRCVFVGGAGSSVSIGRNCDISDNVHFLTGTHEIDITGMRTAGAGISKNINVGNGVWIGYNALILPGVKIGNKAIVGAGTVVHKDVLPNTVVAGNPMRYIRDL